MDPETSYSGIEAIKQAHQPSRRFRTCWKPIPPLWQSTWRLLWKVHRP